MSLQDSDKISRKKYAKLESIIDKMYNEIFKNYSNSKYTQKDILEDTDNYLQSMLLSIGLADKELVENEALFINDLLKHCSLFSDVEINSFIGVNKNIRNEILVKCQSCLKNIPLIFVLSSKIDEYFINETSISKNILASIIDIANCFIYIDNIYAKKECNILIDSLNSIKEYLEQKKVKWN